MKTLRIIWNTLLVASILILLCVQSSAAVTSVPHKTAEMLFLQLVHVSLLFAACTNAVFQYRCHNYKMLCITLFPLVCLALAFALAFFSISFPAWSLYIFDSYCLLWFFYLLITELTSGETAHFSSIVLHTERLTLRPITYHDTNDIFEYSANPEVGPNAGWKPHENKKETKQVLKAVFVNKTDIWGIEDTQTGKIIGSVGLMRDSLRENDKAAMLGYALSKDWWGKGIMTEACREVLRYAFEDEKLTIVSVTHYAFNERSARVIQKCGFSKEGVIRQAEIRYDGAVLDKVVYSLTQEEWAHDR